MKTQHIQLSNHESTEDFNMSATITVMTLLLGFIGSSFYILLSGYM